jgi:hypothetical protein
MQQLQPAEHSSVRITETCPPATRPDVSSKMGAEEMDMLIRNIVNGSAYKYEGTLTTNIPKITITTKAVRTG